MENKDQRRFFELLEPKSALVLGIVSGLLVICTIGFIVLTVLALTRGLNCVAASKTKNVGQQAVAGQNDSLPVAQAPKSDKPQAELFVMSYCPYGLQMEKAFLPVMELLKGKAEMDIKFVSYAMHEKQEIDENTRQYCIQKEQQDKFIKYLTCFTTKDDYKSCLKEAGVNESKMNACVASADKQFGITAKYNDKESWLSGRFPIYPVHQDLNEEYGVAGSPTLVINGVQIDSNRSPEAVKQAICGAFNNPPAECSETLSTQSAGPGFGTAVGANTDASCG